MRGQTMATPQRRLACLLLASLSTCTGLCVVPLVARVPSRSASSPGSSQRLAVPSMDAAATVPAAFSLGAGMVAGALGVGLAYPLDTIKVKAQTYGDTSELSSVELARVVFREEGLDGFYSGVAPTMAGQALIKGVLFFVYDLVKAQLMRGSAESLGLASLTLAAAVSGFVAAFVCTPVERLKVVMQASRSTDFASPMQCLRRIVHEDGVSGLFFRGIGATLAREVCPRVPARPLLPLSAAFPSARHDGSRAAGSSVCRLLPRL